jgi:hypothetical protein
MVSGIKLGDKPTYRLRELDLQPAGGAAPQPSEESAGLLLELSMVAHRTSSRLGLVLTLSTESPLVGTGESRSNGHVCLGCLMCRGAPVSGNCPADPAILSAAKAENGRDVLEASGDLVSGRASQMKA